MDKLAPIAQAFIEQNRREILFRVWDLKENKMFNHAYCGGHCDIAVNTRDGIFSLPDEHDYLVSRRYCVMQYTGCKDVNSKKVYAGDIIKVKETARKWYKEYVQIAKHDLDCWCDWEDIHKVEIIGNVFENPELCPEE